MLIQPHNEILQNQKKTKQNKTRLHFCWHPAHDAEHHEVVHIINIGVLAPHDLISVAKREQMQDKFHIPDAMIVRICVSFILTRLNESDC